MSQCAQELLLEEWKQNVALYIDQDKRGLERIKMFLTVHAGLLILYGILWRSRLDPWSVCAACLVGIAALVLTWITYRMSKRAHAFIHLRRLQAMLIEEEMKHSLAADKPWKTSSGIITTFTREHVSFEKRKDHIAADWRPLIEEIKKMRQKEKFIKKEGKRIGDSITLVGHWGRAVTGSWGALRWLGWLHFAFCVFWVLAAILIVLAHYLDC